LAAVTGGEVASTFDHPELVTLGKCDVIEEVCRKDLNLEVTIVLICSPLLLLAASDNV